MKEERWTIIYPILVGILWVGLCWEVISKL